MIVRRLAPVLMLPLAAVAALAVMTAPTRGADREPTFAVSVDNPTVRLGQKAVIVATISARDGYRITESYRHRIVNVTSLDDGVEIGRKVVRGSVTQGRVVFRVDVVPRTAGAHMVVGVFRFSVNNGQQLDIKAAPFEATVTATE